MTPASCFARYKAGARAEPECLSAKDLWRMSWRSGRTRRALLIFFNHDIILIQQEILYELHRWVYYSGSKEKFERL